MKRQKTSRAGKRILILGLVCALGLAGCGQTESGNGAEEDLVSDVAQESTETAGNVESGIAKEEEGSAEATSAAKETDAGMQETETESAEPENAETEPEVTEPEATEPDVTAPELLGVKNLTVEVGSVISYKRGVVVQDDSGEATLEIDTAQVDLNTVGTYEVVYTATDAAGNATSQTIVVTVVEPAAVTLEEINALADVVIAQVTTEDMTLWEKAEALWEWCHYEIKYSYSAGDRGVLAGAYEGLHDKKGDCYAYYATYEVLLSRVGIENMCVTRIGGTSNHWWNLVNLGDGWYHCDTSPRKVGHKYKCFMQTDEQIAAYEALYTQENPDKPNYFTFESDLYPERATEIVYESKMP